MQADERLPELRRVKEGIEDEFLDRPGVVGVDIGYKEVGGQRTDELAIRVLVEEKRDVPAAERIPALVEGIKTDVIERGRPVAMVDASRYDPVLGGCGIGLCDPDPTTPPGLSAGTLGVLVRDRATGNVFGLTNWHVLVMSQPSTNVAQPAELDGGVCPGDVIGQVGASSITDLVDCALTPVNRGTRAEILGIGWVRGADGTAIGNRVKKRGRTTGLTYGDVDSIDATIDVAYTDRVRRLRRQIGIWRADGVSEVFIRPGDSGSAVVDWNYRVVGLAFAGSSGGPFLPEGAYGWANPIIEVLNALNVDIMVPPKTKEKEKEKEREKDAVVKEQDTLGDKVSVEVGLLAGAGTVGAGTAAPSALPALLGGPLEDRIARLEVAVDQLRHFIGPADRPDVGAGAAADEPRPGQDPGPAGADRPSTTGTG